MNRENNLDLLRIISCIFVVIIHVSGIWIEHANIQNYSFFVSVNTLAKFAVPVFFMLSGHFNIENAKNENLHYFYNKTIRKILIPTFIFTLFYIFVKIVESLLTKNYKTLFYDIVTGNIGALWFLYALIPIYFLVPLIIKTKNRIGENKFVLFSSLYFIFSILFALSSKYYTSFNLGNAINYLGFFLIGSCITRVKLKSMISKIFVFIGILFFGILNIYIILTFQKLTSFGLSNNFLPINVCYSILIFILFNNLKFNYDLKLISSNTFNIYLIHPFFVSIIKILSFTIFIDNTYNYLYFLLILFIIILLSFSFSIVYNNVYNYLNKKIINDKKISESIVNFLIGSD